MKLRTGFTLIEMVVVIAVLLIMAALAIPEFAQINSREIARNFYPGLLSELTYAQNQAKSKNTVTVFQFDSTSNAFTVSGDASMDPLMPGQGQSNPNTSQVTPQMTQGTTAIQNPFTQAASPGMEAPATPVDPASITRSVTVPDGANPSQWTLQGKQVDQSTWVIRFYPDGTSDSGSVTFDYGSSQKTLLVNAQGQVTLTDGMAPDPTTLSWPGGTFEARQ